MIDIHNTADYIIFKLNIENEGFYLENLKLQKLLYYSQAWHLAFNGSILFDGKFQAWVHGPVNRKIYDRFKDHKSLYSRIGLDEIKNHEYVVNIPNPVQAHIDSVLESYGALSSVQLEKMTHEEDPWIKARGNIRPTERCEQEIDEALMQSYYAARL